MFPMIKGTGTWANQLERMGDFMINFRIVRIFLILPNHTEEQPCIDFDRTFSARLRKNEARGGARNAIRAF